ncbi:Transcription factor [Lachnellula hyalina]|uniref:Transcription factor n=1 Tax=Lachnellula hyalina TaxID=1316788 RepID=A0A8H8QWY8_9HELO|nr:Transcription factor [Lachnellula hyalina]TVY24198.1 Transcription factor [Lachnellula hyalina]
MSTMHSNKDPERLSAINSHGNRAVGPLETPHGTPTSPKGAPRTADLLFLEEGQVEDIAATTPASSSGSEQSAVQTLVDRVQRLEHALASASLDVRASSAGCRTKTSAKKEIDRSVWHKTRFYGQSHWVHPFEQARKIICFEYLPGGGSNFKVGNGQANAQASAEVNRLVNECKIMARTIKAANAPQWPSWIPDVEKTLPPRELSDQLLQLYFKTSESSCRILHRSSFWKEYEQYWSSPQSASPCLLFKILLAMALGICFYQGPEANDLRSKAQQWIYATQMWLVMPHEKSRLNIPGLQVQCLLLIARSVFNIGGDLVWITAGAVLRAAINMGFHRDPKYFPRMPVLQGELRRRLWATVLELNLTNAMDSGMSPMISANDYDTEPPLNINDDELTESTVHLPTSKPQNVYTEMSLQLALLRSFSLRTEVTTMINDFRFEPLYSEVIRLGTELMKIYKENNKILANASSDSSPSEQSKPSLMHRKVVDITTQRYLLALHRPFAMKAQSDPQFYYSRKVYIDSAMAVLAHPDPSVVASPLSRGLHDDYHLFCLSGGYLKEVMIHASIVVYMELIILLEEDPDMAFDQDRKESREPYRRMLEQAIEISRQRIAIGGETNVKGHLFMSVAMGHVNAIEAGRPSEEGILEAAQSSAKRCYDMLRARLPSTPDMSLSNQQNFSGDEFANGQLNSDLHYKDIDFTMTDWGTADFDNIPEAWMFSSWNEMNTW